MVVLGGYYHKSDAWALTLLGPNLVPPEDRHEEPHARITPNPAGEWSRIQLRIPVRCEAEVAVYDASGSLIRNLLAGVVDPGTRTLLWDTKDEQGHPAAAGVYFISTRIGGSTHHRSLVLIR